MANAGVEVTPDALRDKFEEINEIDVRLDAASGGTRGKRAIKSALVIEHSDKNEKFVDSVLNTLNEKLTGEQRLAAVVHLSRVLKDAFSDEVDEYVDEKIEEQQEEQEALSEAEADALIEQRKELHSQYNALKNILEMFGTDVSDIPEPKSRRGRRGKRGPRTLSQFQYSIDGEELDEDSNSLATVAQRLGVDGVKELKRIVSEENNIPLTKDEVPDDWEVKINDHVLAANRYMNRRDENDENGDE